MCHRHWLTKGTCSSPTGIKTSTQQNDRRLETNNGVGNYVTGLNTVPLALKLTPKMSRCGSLPDDKSLLLLLTGNHTSSRFSAPIFNSSKTLNQEWNSRWKSAVCILRQPQNMKSFLSFKKIMLHHFNQPSNICKSCVNLWLPRILFILRFYLKFSFSWFVF